MTAAPLMISRLSLCWNTLNADGRNHVAGVTPGLTPLCELRPQNTVSLRSGQHLILPGPINDVKSI